MLDDIKDFLPFIGISIAVVLIISLLSFGLVYGVESWQCNGYAELNPQMEFKFNAATGCMVEYNGMWIPYENLRGVE